MTEQWTDEDEARFEILAEADALDEITGYEYDELQSLTGKRQRTKLKPTAEESAWRFECSKRTKELHDAIDELARFIENPPK